MAKKKAADKRDAKKEMRNGPFTDTRPETMQGVFAVIFFVVGVFFSLAAFHAGATPAAAGVNPGTNAVVGAIPADRAGIVGQWAWQFFTLLFGVGYFLLPLFFFVLFLSFVLNIKGRFTTGRIVSALFGLFSSLGIVDMIVQNQSNPEPGGIIGNLIAAPLLHLFAFAVSLVILFGILIISLLLTFDVRLDTAFAALWKKLTARKIDQKEENAGLDDSGIDEDLEEQSTAKKEEKEIIIPAEMLREDKENEEDIVVTANKFNKKMPAMEADEETAIQPKPLFRRIGNYVPLPLSLLEEDRGKPGVGDIKANANVIKRTLLNFGINVEMDEVTIGPSVTRYALKPAEGVKLARIVALQNDLALALAAHPIRIEAPIPGKSLVGIEIPNSTKTLVGLGSLLGAGEFQESDKPLLVAIGKAISGKSIFANLGKMPHVLIAGATGSGKSVTIHALITSLLYRNSPQNLKFIMIDPKRVELTLYNKIPHLLTPVITEAKKAILSLKWAAKEMDRRYDILEASSVRDIESYHKNVLEPALKKADQAAARNGDAEEVEAKLPDLMPYIVIVIDELADIMQTYPRELEAAIVRLAQMSRAVGIHLMLSTQRPSVNVITGLIKANVPSRIALQVASQVDSRTILDAAGAEKLLGAGDMLYLGGEMSKPLRIQCPYVSETELKKVVKFLAQHYESELPSDITVAGSGGGGMGGSAGNGMGGLNENGGPAGGKNPIFDGSLSFENDTSLDGDDDDELYEEARQIIIEAGKASTSYIQRKLRVGYARAARLMDLLEERGVIGPADGSKPRSVLGDEHAQPAQENHDQAANG